MAHLDIHGYAVISGIADPGAIVKAKDDFWSFWEKEKFRGNLDRNDINTWNNWMANAATGIIVSSRCANHNSFLWGARTLPKVRATFEKIWNENKLIVSYDAGGVFRPWKYNIQWLTNGGWWHVDQNSTKGPQRQGRVTIQGLVTYYDATAETGGLCVIPGSHHYHNELCERVPSAKAKIDFVSVPVTDPILRSAEPVLVCAQAGDLILWDSRTVHCNTPALSMANHHRDLLNKGNSTAAVDPTSSATSPPDLLRLVAYVCLSPVSHASPDILFQRKQAFLHRLGTSHYPTCEMGHFPRERLPPWTTNREVLRLVGYSEEEIGSIQEGRDPEFREAGWWDACLFGIVACSALYYLLLHRSYSV